MEIIYDKLVRDNIPEKIIANGGQPFCRKLDDEEYWKYLLKKDLEELEEVRTAPNREEILKELGDKLELIIAMAEFNNYSLEDVIREAERKKSIVGGFQKRLVLEKVIEQ